MKTISVILIIAGALSLFLSILFKLTHWPGINLLIAIGLTFFISGLYILIRLQNKS